MSDSQTGQDQATATEQAQAGGEVPTSSLWGDAWRQLRSSPMFIISALLLVTFIVMAIAPQLFTNADPRSCPLSNSLQSPSGDHWFGTDVQGCDYYARVLYGARISMTVGMLVTAGTLLIAIVLGLVAGFYGGWVDAVISRLVDMVFALPFILGAIVFLNVLENRGVWQISFVLIIFSWTTMTRLMRSSVIAAKSNEYVSAARALGASDVRIMRQHILPNALAPLVVYATVFIGLIIAAEATLTFLGVGVQLPSISWGLQLSEAQSRILTHPHLVLFPAIFVGLTVFAFVMMGDALRDALDPKQR